MHNGAVLSSLFILIVDVCTSLPPLPLFLSLPPSLSHSLSTLHSYTIDEERHCCYDQEHGQYSSEG